MRIAVPAGGTAGIRAQHPGSATGIRGHLTASAVPGPLCGFFSPSHRLSCLVITSCVFVQHLACRALDKLPLYK